jgi:hypothetical protein
MTFDLDFLSINALAMTFANILLRFNYHSNFFGKSSGLNSGLCACRAGALLPEPLSSSFCSGCLEMGVHELFAQAGLEPSS